MDFFDIAILLFTFELIFYRFIPQRVFLFSIYLGVLTAIAQILVVGYKWQYMPIYFIIFAYSVRFTYSSTIFNKVVSRFSSFVMFLIFIIALFLNFVFPVPTFEIENFKYTVGYEEIHIKLDKENPKAFVELSNLEPGSNRELLVDIYYPSNEESDYVQLVKDEGKIGGTIVQYLNRTWDLNIPEVLLEHLSLINFQVSENIKPIDEKLPVVVYSHGWAGTKFFAAEQLMNLASQGYIVIAVDHTGLAMFTNLPDKTIYNTGSSEVSSNIFNVMNGMAVDIEDTLRFLQDNELSENLNIVIKNNADFNNVSLIGHSTGGGSIFLYCTNNPCQTMVLQDPFFTPLTAELGTLNMPSDSYWIYSQDWYKGFEPGVETPEFDVYKNQFNNNGYKSESYYLKDSRHYDFIAFGSISPLSGYTFLKGPIPYKNVLESNNSFNLAALTNNKIIETEYLIKISK
jgi:dienelactone hydrolase